MIDAGVFLEYAEVFGTLLGTARQSLDDALARRPRSDARHRRAGRGAGARKMPEAVSIFVMPPTPKVLRTRLRNRSRAEGVMNEEEAVSPPGPGSQRD